MNRDRIANRARDRTLHPCRAGWTILVLTALAPALAAAQDANAPTCRYSGRAEIALAAPQPGDTLRLPHRIIASEDFLLTQGGRVFRAGRDYRLIAVGGEIQWLTAEIAPTVPLLARYRYLPLPIQAQWGAALADRLPDTLAIEPSASAPVRDLPEGARLEVGGSKTFSVDFGNRRDVGISQSLDLTINGQLAENVRLQAILTDRSTPLQAEGTSAELSDVDQVLVNLDSPWGELHLGDIRVGQREIAFLAHQREMEGLSAHVSPPGRYGGHAAVGRGLGEHRTLQRFGEDGKQGPYRLLSQGPGTEAVVIAGSERIWLDDERLQRGEDGDYVIDYGTGELWFTTRKPISAVSQIRADFQVRQSAFDREYYSLAAAAGDSAIGLAVAWLRERDNPDHSPLIALGDEERAALREAGDSTSSALASGVVEVPEGEGDYVLAESDTLDTPFFVYVGPADPLDPSRPGGSYLVRFTDVGTGRGDYADTTDVTGDRFYTFVGRRRGSFLPGRSVPLPGSLDVVGLRARGTLPGKLRLTAEAAVSQNDRNVLSPRDDSDNNGHAILLNGDWAAGDLLGGHADALALRFHYREVGEHYVSPEPLDRPFQHRVWNASSASVLDGRDRRGGFGASFRPWSSFRVGGDWERLRAADRFDGERWSVRAERAGTLSASGELSRSRSHERGESRKTERERVELGWSGPAILTTFYETEDLRNGAAGREDGEGHRATGGRAEISRAGEGLRAALGFQVRWDHKRSDGAEMNAARRRLVQLEFGYARTPWNAEIQLARSLIDRTMNLPERTGDLFDWVFARANPAGGTWSAEWRGRVTTADERLRAGELLAVGAGAGHYDSTGAYVGPGGDYEFHFVRSDSSALETHLETALRVNARPFAVAGGRAFWRGFEETFYARLEGATPETMARVVQDPASLFAGDESWTRHDRLLRSDLTWRAAARLPEPRLRIEERDRSENPAGGYGRRERRILEELEVRWPFREEVSIRAQAGQDHERESFLRLASGVQEVSELRARRGLLELSGRIYRPFGWRAGAEARRERLQPRARVRHSWKAAGAAIAELQRGGRVELAYERTWADAAAGSAPFLLERAGWEWSLTGSLRPKSGMTASIRVSVERREEQSLVTRGRMELRAFF